MDAETKEVVNDNYKEVWKLLGDLGLNFGERLKIRKAFSDWGKKFNDDIKYDYKYNTYSSTKITGYGFYKEDEVKFFNALIDFAPDSNAETILKVMGIVIKLLDIKSDMELWSNKTNK